MANSSTLASRTQAGVLHLSYWNSQTERPQPNPAVNFVTEQSCNETWLPALQHATLNFA